RPTPARYVDTKRASGRCAISGCRELRFSGLERLLTPSTRRVTPDSCLHVDKHNLRQARDDRLRHVAARAGSSDDLRARRRRHGDRQRIASAATNADTTNTMKKSAWPPRRQGRKISPRSMASTRAATIPPPRLARNVEMNHMPMRSETYRAGAAFVT